MLLEINVGLLGATAIIGSLLTVGPEILPRPRSVKANSWMRRAITGFSISVVLSIYALTIIIVSSYLGLPEETLFVTITTLLSLFIFGFSTQILAIISSARFLARPRRANT